MSSQSRDVSDLLRNLIARREWDLFMEEINRHDKESDKGRLCFKFCADLLCRRINLDLYSLSTPDAVFESINECFPYVWRETNAKGENALHQALECGASLTTIQKIIRIYPNLTRWPDGDGYLPLHRSLLCKSPREESFNAVLDAYPRAAAVIANGKNALMMACSAGRVAFSFGGFAFAPFNGLVCPWAVKRLCEQFPEGAQHRDHDGRIALHYACSDRSILRVSEVTVINALLAANRSGAATRSNDGDLPLHELCRLHVRYSEHAMSEAFRLLLDAHPTALEEANEEGQLPINCLQRSRGGVPGDSRGEFLLFLARRYPEGLGNPNIELSGRTPLHDLFTVLFENKKQDVTLRQPSLRRNQNLGETITRVRHLKEALAMELIQLGPTNAFVCFKENGEIPLATYVRTAAMRNSFETLTRRHVFRDDVDDGTRVWRDGFWNETVGRVGGNNTEEDALEDQAALQGVGSDLSNVSSPPYKLLKRTIEAIRDDSTADQQLSIVHMVASCSRFLQQFTLSYLLKGLSANKSCYMEKDSLGNLPIHTCCSAKSPQRGAVPNGVDLNFKNGSSRLGCFLNQMSSEDQVVAGRTRNLQGRLPIHILVSNSYPYTTMVKDVSTLLKLNLDSDTEMDPITKLHPFMLAAADFSMHEQDLSEAMADRISVTFCLLKSFTASRDLTHFNTLRTHGEEGKAKRRQGALEDTRKRARHS